MNFVMKSLGYIFAVLFAGPLLPMALVLYVLVNYDVPDIDRESLLVVGGYSSFLSVLTVAWLYFIIRVCDYII